MFIIFLFQIFSFFQCSNERRFISYEIKNGLISVDAESIITKVTVYKNNKIKPIESEFNISAKEARQFSVLSEVKDISFDEPFLVKVLAIDKTNKDVQFEFRFTIDSTLKKQDSITFISRLLFP